jgi:hypothetical protein
MIPTATRYVTFEGTRVQVAPRSAEEAKAAVKELRHKKKELAWQKRTLQRERKIAEERKARTEPDRKRKAGLIASLKRLWAALTLLPRLVERKTATADIGAIDKELAAIDETLHNIDSAIIQVQGKLLHS